jgi:hypothetical protein
MATDMIPDDLAALRKAVQLLEHPGLAARLTNLVGKPIELMGLALPPSASRALVTATSRGLELALQSALRTMTGPIPANNLRDEPAAKRGQHRNDSRAPSRGE